MIESLDKIAKHQMVRIIGVLLINAIPIVGVILFGWSVFHIAVLFALYRSGS